jgi:hypothetical protein
VQHTPENATANATANAKSGIASKTYVPISSQILGVIA